MLGAGDGSWDRWGGMWVGCGMCVRICASRWRWEVRDVKTKPVVVVGIGGMESCARHRYCLFSPFLSSLYISTLVVVCTGLRSARFSVESLGWSIRFGIELFFLVEGMSALVVVGELIFGLEIWRPRGWGVGRVVFWRWDGSGDGWV